METLKDVYEKHRKGLETLYEGLKKENLFYSCSYPLLLSTWDNELMPELMFFGQETNGWDWDDVPECPDNEGSINYLMALYNDFDFGKGRKAYNTLFWQYIRSLSKSLGYTSEHSFLWNNINKLGKDSGKGRPNTKATELENRYFNVLVDELNVINPKICIFLTGPNYDKDIKAKLTDAEFIPIDGYDIKEFARIKSSHLPEKSFRYHPGYGNRVYDWYQEVLKRIGELAK